MNPLLLSVVVVRYCLPAPGELTNTLLHLCVSEAFRLSGFSVSVGEQMATAARALGSGTWGCAACALKVSALFSKMVPRPPSSAQSLAACPRLLLINHFIGTAGQQRTEWVMGVRDRVVDKGPSWHGNNKQTGVSGLWSGPLTHLRTGPRSFFPCAEEREKARQGTLQGTGEPNALYTGWAGSSFSHGW